MKLITFGSVVSEKKSFENVDGRKTDDGGCLSYKPKPPSPPRSLRLRGAKNCNQNETLWPMFTPE